MSLVQVRTQDKALRGLALESILVLGLSYSILSFCRGQGYPLKGVLFFEEIFFLGILVETIFYSYELYDEGKLASIKGFFLRMGIWLLASGTLILGLYFYPPARHVVGHFLSDNRLDYVVLILLLVTVMHQPSLIGLLAKMFPPKRVLILGSGDLAHTIVSDIKKDKWARYKIISSLQPNSADGQDRLLDGNIERFEGQLPFLIAEKKIDKIIIAASQRRGRLPLEELLTCKMRGVEVVEAQDFYEQLSGKVSVRDLRPSWLIFTPGFKQHPRTLFVKSVWDVVLAVVGLVLSAPLMLIVAVLIKLDSSGPVLFKQVRVGHWGRPFTLYKFRTMCNGAEDESGPVWAQENDIRVTRVGKFIRNYRIDELPQMINVLKGEMSFIGPRPERPYFVERLQKEVPYYKQRLVVKPGITGWAAVKYQYGASVDDAVEKLQYDLYYIKNLSLFLELVIVLKTIQVICSGEGSR